MSLFRRRLMMASSIGGGSSVPGVEESEAGDICVYDVNKGTLAIIKSAEWSASKYPIANYVPIGVVVVPASHNVYGDGSCGVMSLNHMNCSSPTTGGSAQDMRWGSSMDIDTLENLNQVPCVGDSYDLGDTVISASTRAYLPSDRFAAVTNPYDDGTGYRYIGSRYNYAPSPYNNDGTFNTNYSMTDSPLSTANCLADFDGKGNTQKILTVRGSKDYSSWKPSQYIESDYPAASCCDMYFTQGTNQGDWYLPAAGELGYAVVRQEAINDKIDQLLSAGVSTVDFVDPKSHWSSSEHSSSYARILHFSDGRVDYPGKGDYSYVRAFLRV